MRPVLVATVAASAALMESDSRYIEVRPRPDQRLYLDWLQGRASGRRLLEGKAVVLVSRRSSAARELSRDRRFTGVAGDASMRLFVRNS